MGQTRIFRDRVVSMEQTLEGGEKSLELLKELCREAYPDFEYREHSLDHERDLFVLSLEASGGRRKTVAWTRMVLFDAERIPALVDNPVTGLRQRILDFLRARAGRSDIVVTFRHLEEGWKDTPEARPARRRRRKGGRPEIRAGRPSERGPARPPGPRPSASDSRRLESRPESRRGTLRSPEPPASTGARTAPQPQPRPASPAGIDSRPAASPPAPSGPRAPGAARRRSRRRRRGRGGGGPVSTPASP